jgi:hypothetical protein
MSGEGKLKTFAQLKNQLRSFLIFKPYKGGLI